MIASDTACPKPWYAVPYYPGGELSRYAGKLSHQQLLAVAARLARILSEFHASAGAFGDFKPANIFGLLPRGAHDAG